MKNQRSTCPICGHQWVTGNNGSHSCTDKLLKTISAKDKELSETYERITEQKELIEDLLMIKNIAINRLTLVRCKCGTINEKGYVCSECGKD